VELNRLLRFVEIDAENRYAFLGDTAEIYRIESRTIFDHLCRIYTDLANCRNPISLPDFYNSLSAEVLRLPADIIRELLFTDNQPPILKNEFEDFSFFAENQSQFSGFFIFVTYDCNLNCLYCTYSGIYPKERHHLPVHMSPSLAMDVIRYIQSASANSEKVNIVFYGDEPLMNFTAVRKIIEVLSSHERAGSERKYAFQIVTNGTLLTNQIIEFCIHHGIRLQISIDGPPEIHDRYRKTRNFQPTHRCVIEKLELLRHISETYYCTKVGINCTLAPPFQLEEVDQYFIREALFEPFSGHIGNFSVSIMNMQGTKFYQRKDLDDFRKQIKSIRDAFANYLMLGDQGKARFLPAAMFEAAFYNFTQKCLEYSISSRWIHPGECIPGIGGLAIGADGTLFVCNSFNRQPIGTIYSGVDLNEVKTMRQRYIELRNGKCRKCWLFRFCPICLAAFKYAETNENFEDVFDCSYTEKKAEDILKIYIAATERTPERLRDFLKRRLSFS
jgi:uncharacterized protein